MLSRHSFSFLKKCFLYCDFVNGIDRLITSIIITIISCLTQFYAVPFPTNELNQIELSCLWGKCLLVVRCVLVFCTLQIRLELKAALHDVTTPRGTWEDAATQPATPTSRCHPARAVQFVTRAQTQTARLFATLSQSGTRCGQGVVWGSKPYTLLYVARGLTLKYSTSCWKCIYTYMFYVTRHKQH